METTTESQPPIEHAHTTVCTIDITCPAWCTADPQSHADELWNLGGCVDHRSDHYPVADPIGWGRPLEERKFYPAFPITLAALTLPDGSPQDTPLLWLDGTFVTLDQALAIADQIRNLAHTYRTSANAMEAVR